MVCNISSPQLNHKRKLIQSFVYLFRIPLAILASLVGGVTLYILAPSASVWLYFRITIVLSCMSSAACAINDYWDLEKDRIDHPERPLPAGYLNLDQAQGAAIVLFTLALVVAWTLGFYPFILVATNVLLLWYYSHLLLCSGILGNIIVAMVVSGVLFWVSLVASRPFAMMYPIGFTFCYVLAKEIVSDIHDVSGDRNQGIVTLASGWGPKTAFVTVWGLVFGLLASVPIAFLTLPINKPGVFATFTSLMLLCLGWAIFQFQKTGVRKTFVFWERLSVLAGLVGLLGAAPA